MGRWSSVVGALGGQPTAAAEEQRKEKKHRGRRTEEEPTAHCVRCPLPTAHWPLGPPSPRADWAGWLAAALARSPGRDGEGAEGKIAPALSAERPTHAPSATPRPSSSSWTLDPPVASVRKLQPPHRRIAASSPLPSPLPPSLSLPLSRLAAFAPPTTAGPVPGARLAASLFCLPCPALLCSACPGLVWSGLHNRLSAYSACPVPVQCPPVPASPPNVRQRALCSNRRNVPLIVRPHAPSHRPARIPDAALSLQSDAHLLTYIDYLQAQHTTYSSRPGPPTRERDALAR